MPDISVIIPSFNHIEHLQRCVSSILNQQCSGTFEIIIVDSSPSDVQNKIELMFKTNDLIHLIKLPNQTFPGIARNIGIKQAKGKYIGMIDADCSAEGGWLECITKYVKENTVICGTIKNGTPYSIWGTLSYLVEFNQFLESTHPPVEIEGASTGNFGCEKILFEKYGYFSDYRAFEDFFFASNLKKQGGKILKVSGFTITHHNRTTFNQIWKNINMLGLLSAKVRRENNLPPKLIFRFPALAFLLTFYRYFSGLKNTLHSKYFFSYILLSPLLIILFLGWSTGFYEGSKEEGKI
jgi:glycosyltransferase involved in cell wall biosynthesis